MQPFHHIINLKSIAFGAALTISMAALAQTAPLPEPPAAAELPNPVNNRDKQADRLKPPTKDEVADFLKGYKRLGRPSMVVLCGLDARASGVVKVGTQATPIGGGTGGEVLLDFDPTGFCDQFAANLTEPLNPDGRVKFKDLQLLRAAESKMKDELKTADEDAALETIGKSLGVDMILYTRFVPRTAQQIRQDGCPLAATTFVKWVGDAGMISLGAFDVDGQLNNYTARTYANVVNKRHLIPKFKNLDPGRDVSLWVLGANPDQTTAMRKLISKLDSVDGDVDQAKRKTSDGDDFTQYSFSITNHKMADLLDNYRAGVKAELLSNVSVISQDSNKIVVRFGEGDESSKPAWYAITDTDSKSANPQRDAFISFVQKQHSPRIGVVVNWMVESNQLGWMPYWYRYGHLVQQGDAPALGNEFFGPQLEELEKIQNSMQNILIDPSFNLHVQSLDGVQADIESQLAKSHDHASPEETFARLKDKYDYIIWGKARVVTKDQAGDGRKASYTFSLYQPSTGRFLGAVPWNGDRNSLNRAQSKSVPHDFFTKDDTANNCSRFLIGKLLADWQSARPMIQVEVHGVKNIEPVQALADSLSHIEGAAALGVRFDAPTTSGEFDVAFTGNAEELNQKIQLASKQIPNSALAELHGNKIVFELK